MEDIEQRTGASETLRPCKYFDLIGGTSTGGLIAIMLGLLGMVFLSSKSS
jgi:patatin-like phospholipase/acyl hydrolase